MDQNAEDVVLGEQNGMGTKMNGAVFEKSVLLAPVT